MDFVWFQGHRVRVDTARKRVIDWRPAMNPADQRRSEKAIKNFAAGHRLEGVPLHQENAPPAAARLLEATSQSLSPSILFGTAAKPGPDWNPVKAGTQQRTRVQRHGCLVSRR
jgi:hypothetical protein